VRTVSFEGVDDLDGAQAVDGREPGVDEPGDPQVPDGAPHGETARPGPGAGRSSSVSHALSRRTRLVLGAGGLVVVLLAAVSVVRGQATEDARVEQVVAAGGVRSLAGAAEVVWRIDAGNGDSPWFIDPVVVDGVLVVPGPQVAGYDPDTGQERWRAPRDPASADGTTVRCEVSGTEQDVSSPVLCTTFARPHVGPDEAVSQERPLHVQVIAPATGEVLVSRSVDASTVAVVAAFGDGLVAGSWSPDGSVVLAHDDLRTGERRWVRELPPTGSDSRYAASLGLWSVDGELRVETPGLSAWVDARGEVRSGEDYEEWTAPLGEGRTVVYRLDGTASVREADGDEAFTTRGIVREFPATDGAAGEVLFVDAGGDVVDASGAIAPPRLEALDAATGRTLWSVAGTVFEPVARVGDVGVLAGAGRLLGVDLRTGEQRWESPGVVTYQSAHTDGVDVLLVGQNASGGTRVAAYSAEDGRELWESTIPGAHRRSFDVDGRLVVVVDDGVLLGLG
jgi:outer membrane protein assembly factor BamB